MLEWRQAVLIQYLEHNSYDVIQIGKYVIYTTLQNFPEYLLFLSSLTKNMENLISAKYLRQILF